MFEGKSAAAGPTTNDFHTAAVVIQGAREGTRAIGIATSIAPPRLETRIAARLETLALHRGWRLRLHFRPPPEGAQATS